MAIRKIFTFPDPILHRVAEPVETFDSTLSSLVSDMVETMRYAPGIGLAAPQVGESLRLIVVEVPTEDEGPPTLYAVCNPMVTKRSGDARIEEGCLSLPGFYTEVDRAAQITLEGNNPDGSHFSIEAEGLLAICFQHEIDHLDGKLLVNYVSSVKRDLYRAEARKRRANAGGTPDDRRKTL